MLPSAARVEARRETNLGCDMMYSWGQNQCLLSRTVCTQQQHKLASGSAHIVYNTIFCVHWCDRCADFDDDAYCKALTMTVL